MTERGLKNINGFYSTFTNVFFYFCHVFFTFFNVFYFFLERFYIYDLAVSAPILKCLVFSVLKNTVRVPIFKNRSCNPGHVHFDPKYEIS